MEGQSVSLSLMSLIIFTPDMFLLHVLFVAHLRKMIIHVMQINKAGVAAYNANKMTTVGHAQLCQPVSNIPAFFFCQVFLAMLGCNSAVGGSAVTTQSITLLHN